MRKKAGHSWSLSRRGKRMIAVIQRHTGEWITTGEAQGWPRCSRCRRPTERSPFCSGLCDICYFYKTGLSSEAFWGLHNAGYFLAPYNIGKRCTTFRVPETMPKGVDQ